MDEIFGMLDNDDTLSVDDLKYMLETYFPCLTREDFERIYQDYFVWKKEESEGQPDTGDFEFLYRDVSLTDGHTRGKGFYEKWNPGESDFIRKPLK